MFTWTKVAIDPYGQVRETNTTSFRIDLRESVFNFMEQQVYTRDTVLLDVNALMYYRIFDVKKAVYEVDDLQAALSNTAQTQLKEVFGNMTFSEALQSQTKINEHLVKEFGKLFMGWGIHVERMELLNLAPNKSTPIAESMKKQMVAERNRRGEFILSEGKKAAMRINAEGNKVVRMNYGIADQESMRKRSEGDKDAKIEIAYAESRSLELLGEALKPEGASQADYMMSQRYLDVFKQMGAQVSNKAIYLPYDISGLGGSVNDLSKAYGKNADRVEATAGSGDKYSVLD